MAVTLQPIAQRRHLKRGDIQAARNGNDFSEFIRAVSAVD
jgi:hypothetical protein